MGWPYGISLYGVSIFGSGDIPPRDGDAVTVEAGAFVDAVTERRTVRFPWGPDGHGGLIPGIEMGPGAVISYLQIPTKPPIPRICLDFGTSRFAVDTTLAEMTTVGQWASLLTARLDTSLGAQGRLLIQGCNDTGRFYNILSMVGYADDFTTGNETGHVVMSNWENGVAKPFLTVTKDAIELNGTRALKVNGSVGNPGDVLVSQGPGLPPKWQAP